MNIKLLIKVTILISALSILFSVLMFILPLIPFIILAYFWFEDDIKEEMPLDENLGAFLIVESNA